jgi:Flp pilus assembly protein CpaB
MGGYPQKRSRRGLRLVVAVLLATSAAGAVLVYTSSVQRAAAQQQSSVAEAAVSAPATPVAVTPRVSVVVARADVQAHTPLSADAFEVRDMPQDAAAPDAVTSLDALAGKQLDSPMSAGQQLVTSRLVDAQTGEVKSFADTIPPGLRAMSLTFSELNGAAGLIVPGNHVDVAAVFKKDTLGKDESMIMLQDVLVLAVAQATTPDELASPAPPSSPNNSRAQGTPPAAPAPLSNSNAKASSTVATGADATSTPARTSTTTTSSAPPSSRFPTAPSQAKTITLAVAPEAVERLALAEQEGNLRYVIRPTSDQGQQSIVPADLGTLSSPLDAAAAQIIATEISPTNVKVGDTMTVKITVKNTSDKPLQTEGPAPGFTYVQGQTYYTQQFPSQPGKWRVGIGTAGLDSTELPYRWGLGGDLAPGATTTVTGQIKVTSDFKPTNFWAAIVEEPAHMVQTGVGITLVTSLPENVAVVAVDAANARSGPSIASSVVTQVPYGTQLEIVGQNADWFKVVLPDQRQAWVAAGWIVTPGR